MHNSSVEDTNFNNNRIKINGILIDFTVPKIMGILNITEDSFYEESRLRSDSELLKKAEQYLSEGATFLDLGGFSTRPGAVPVEESVELLRVRSALKQLKKEFPDAFVAVDTFRGNVAQAAIDEGADVINDISGFQFDETMIDVIEGSEAAYVLMHVEGTFETMHNVSLRSEIMISQYCDITKRVGEYFSQKLAVLEERGVKNIILDPGFGFSKTLEENHELLHRMNELLVFEKPVLAGVSRKSMICKKLGITPEESLNGTTVLNTVAVLKGAGILRVHDVKPCKEVIDLLTR